MNNNIKSMFAIFAILSGFAFGFYLWLPNTQPISGDVGNNNSQVVSNLVFNNSVPQFLGGGGPFEEGAVETENVTEVSTGPVLGLVVEKYRSTSMDGPWDEADTPLGQVTVGQNGEVVYVYYKVTVNNIGDVALDIEFMDLYDGVELNLESLTGSPLPSNIMTGETLEFSYKLRGTVDVHKNEIKVTGKYGDEEIKVTDIAFYEGFTTHARTSNEEIPHFVIPEYPFGALGGIMSILFAYLLVNTRKQRYAHF